MKLQIKKGSTSVSLYLFIQDSSVTTGAGKTGLAYNTSSLVGYYVRPLASATSITLATQTVTGAYSSGGFVEVDSTNMPGLYRFDIPDAALATGVNSVVCMLKGATNMAPVVLEIELVAYDPQDATRQGLTALPNANAEASGGLYTRGSGAGQINQPANGQIDANTVKIGGTTQTARDLGASVLLSPGTGTGQLDITSGVVKSNLAQILGTALTETAGQIAAGFKQFFDVASPTGTMKAITNVVTASNLTTNNDKAGYGLSSTAIQAIWDALTSALTTVGSIGKLLVTNIDATISSRLASASYTAPSNSDITAIKAKTDNLPASPAATSDIPTANANADALLDRAAGVETGFTIRQAMRIMLSALGGKLSGAAGTTVVIRDANDSKDRITATVDANGDRSAVTLDAS